MPRVAHSGVFKWTISRRDRVNWTLCRYIMPTLEELENDVWGAPEFDSRLVTTCHKLRKKPIDDFTIEELRIMIGENIGLQFFVPRAVSVLERNPLAEGDNYPGDLLNAVTIADSSFFERSPLIVDRVTVVAKMAIDQLDSSTDDSHLIQNFQRFINKYLK